MFQIAISFSFYNYNTHFDYHSLTSFFKYLTRIP